MDMVEGRQEKEEIKCLRKGGVVESEEAQAKMRGARSCYVARGGPAKKLEIFFWAKKGHDRAWGHSQTLPKF